MRLSTIKLAGFKSFVEPTKIPFPDQMTCVVGPNGCGKSNVIDAVRWVLGESSAKNLRGDAMTDVIFNGSTNRKPISQASVELVFDNTSGHLPNTFADRNQVAIKRLVTRDGQSIYFLNGSKCRKRDITDIFLGTGLGPRSYAIIEQGMISRLIESKPADLRVFLEEAAGVSKYKERRRETQTRIKSTRENLERLLDVRQELQTQLDKLAVQSVDAKKYRELKATERTLKGQIAVLKWQKLHQQQIDKAEQINKLKEQIQFFREAHSGHDDVLASLENQVQLEQQKLQDAQQAQHQTHTELTRKEQQQISLKQQQQTLSQNLIKQQQLQLQNKELQEEQHASAAILQEQLQDAIEQSLLCAEQVAEVEEQVAFKQQQTQSANEQYQSTLHKNQAHSSDINVAKSQQAHFALSLAQLETQQTQLAAEISELEATPVAAQIAEQQQHIQTLTKELAQQQSALNKLTHNLEQADKDQQHLEQDLKRVQQHSNENKASIAALNSLLSEQTDSGSVSLLAQLKVASGFEPLVEQALLGLEHLKVSQYKEPNSVWPVTNNAELPKESLVNYIESGAYPDILARFAFQPCFDDAILADPYWLAVIDEEGCIHGRNFHTDANKDTDNSLLLKYAQLSDAQQLDEELNEQLETKQQLLNEHLAHKKTLTADKEQYRERIHQAAQQIASASTRRDMLLEQQTQWQNQLVKLQQRQTLLAEQKQNADEQQQTQQTLLEQLLEQQLELETELEQAKHQQTEANNNYRQVASQLEQYKTQAHQANLAEQKARSECQLSETKLQHANAAQSAASEAVLELTEQLEELVIPLEEVAEQIMLLLEKHQQSDVELKNLQAALSQAKKELADKQIALKSSQSELVTLQEQLQALALDEQSLIVKAQAALEPLEELQQNLKTVLEELPDNANLNSMQTLLTKTTQALNELGAVNLAAIDEFEQAKQRSDYLNQQLDDLTQALNTLEGAIQKIDRETKNRFKATFEQVNTDFGELFPKVFGGGSAYLELTSDDLLESGVSIMARPPGKKNSTIHLLSGGEKALTALSLVFSIFRLNPAPFCMLDEVDAPLDDANVGRFCRLVEEMSQSVQFIYISHNKIAMEMAGRLTGVTMAEPGVSRMVAVDIEQAVQMAHA
ncbi:chromosome segregation SMC family protein [Pseudoalteromonas sp. 68 DY56-GL68]|uniref:chromosome segregation SMC family protein n=1 Tax=Pseudoalteromonas sp. 68 DY56-GL68 TaxID=2974919 RepID=UPI003529F828